MQLVLMTGDVPSTSGDKYGSMIDPIVIQLMEIHQHKQCTSTVVTIPPLGNIDY